MSMAGNSIVLTVAQPAARTFDLFTNVVMLHKGYQLYFGPVKDVKDYFLSKGMTFPEGGPKTLPQWCEELCSDPTLHFDSSHLSIAGEATSEQITSYLVKEYRESPYFKSM